MSARDYDNGFRAGLLFAIDQAQRVADGVEVRAVTKRADGAAQALRVLAEELLREIGGDEGPIDLTVSRGKVIA